MCIMVISGLSVLCTIIVLCVRHSDPTHRAPVWLRQLALHKIAQLLCMGRLFDDQLNAESLCTVAYYRSRGSNVRASQIWNESILNSQLYETSSQRIRLSSEGHVNDMFFDSISIRRTSDTISSIFEQKQQQHPVSHATSAAPMGVGAEQRMHKADCKNTATCQTEEGNSTPVKISTSGAARNNNNSDHADNREQTQHDTDSSMVVLQNVSEWQAIARVLDRLFFVIFLTGNVGFTSALGFVFAFCSPTEIDVITVS